MQQKPLRILEVNKLYPPHVGGIETMVQVISEGLLQVADVSALVCRHHGRKIEEVVNGVPVTRCRTLATLFSCPISLSFFTHFWKRAKQADVIHFHAPFPPADLACILSRYPGRVVISWHSDVIKQKRLRVLYQPLMRRFLKRADAIVVATKGHIDSSPDLLPFREKCHIIPYGIRTSEYLSAPRRPYLTARCTNPASKKLFFAGRLVYYKGVDILLDAFSQVEHCELFLAGQGELEDVLREKAKQLGISDKVHFLGCLSDADLKASFADCDVFVLPSVKNSEAFGIVQLEAMVYGKPVINTALPTGVPCVSLHQKTGLTVPPGDAAALAQAIGTLLSDDRLRETYGAAAKERVLREFELDTMLKRLSAVMTASNRTNRKGVSPV